MIEAKLDTMKTIIWDVDDVLNDLMRVWLEESWLPGHPEQNVTYEDLTENPPHRLLGIEFADYLRSLDAFRASNLTKLLPVPEVLAWFRAHGSEFRNIALTAVPLRAAGNQARWVIEHFGSWIRSFNFIPSARLEESLPIYDPAKRDFLNWFGKANFMIDDNPNNIKAACDLEIKTFIMPRPWNDGRTSLSSILDTLADMAHG